MDAPESEEEIFGSLDLQYIEPELRESAHIISLAEANKIPTLVDVVKYRFLFFLSFFHLWRRDRIFR